MYKNEIVIIIIYTASAFVIYISQCEVFSSTTSILYMTEKCVSTYKVVRGSYVIITREEKGMPLLFIYIINNKCAQ